MTWIAAMFVAVAWACPQDDQTLDARIRAARVPQAREQAVRVRTMDVLHMEAELDVDLSARSIAGSVRLDFRTFPAPRRQVEVDAQDLVIESITNPAEEPLTWTTNGSTLTVDLGREITPQEETSVRITYRGTPRRGLHFVPGEGEATQVWTQGQSEMTRAWLPCRDTPDDRATLRLSVTVPKALRSFSNGVLESSEDVDGGRRRDTWHMAQPFPAYLTTLVVGTFDEYDLGSVRDVQLMAYAPPGHPHTGDALQRTGSMLRFMEELTGVPYPYAEYRQVLVDDFPYGGMENVTCSTLNVDRMPLPGADVAETRTFEALVMHELAHQWWGDWVTCGTWSDLWLNEGFVSYAEVLDLEQSAGPDAAFAHLLDQQESAHRTLSKSGRAIVCTHYASPDELYDGHTYDAGSSALHHLRGVIGDDAFFAGLKAWSHDRANQCVTTADFEETFQGVTTLDLSSWFTAWLRSPGAPTLEAAWSFADGALTLTWAQTQAGDGVPDVFPLRADVEFRAAGDDAHQVPVDLTERTGSVQTACAAAPEYVAFAARGWAPATWTVAQTPTQWAAQLRRATHVRGRIQAARALQRTIETTLTAADLTETPVWIGDAFTAMARAATSDPSWVVRRAASTALGAPPTALGRTALMAAMHDEDARVREAAVRALASFEGDPITAQALMELTELESSIPVQVAVLETLGGLGFAEAADLMIGRLDARRSEPRIRGAALRVLAKLAPDRAEPRALDALTTRTGRLPRADVITALGTLAPASETAANALIPLVSGSSIRERFQAAGALDGATHLSLKQPLWDALELCTFDDLADLIRSRLADVQDAHGG